jgi:hypothetical protein
MKILYRLRGDRISTPEIPEAALLADKKALGTTKKDSVVARPF